MNRLLAIGLLTLTASGSWALAPEISPLPVPRGAAEAVLAAAEQTGTAEKEPAAAAPEAEEDAEFIACLDDLRELGVEAETVDPVADADMACGIARPVRISTAGAGVAVSPDAVMRCATARALGRWVNEFLLPASRLLPVRGALTRIDHGSAYICRRRNNAPDGKLSEHSFGNAVDVMAFHFAEGPPIPVQPREREGTPAEAFQDAARSTACLTFTTVLGPGSDEAHADHLHLDIRERRGGFRLCQ